jgi:hypothetical protein
LIIVAPEGAPTELGQKSLFTCLIISNCKVLVYTCHGHGLDDCNGGNFPGNKDAWKRLHDLTIVIAGAGTFLVF